MTVHQIIHEVDRLARRQHGVVHRDQLFRIGVTRSMIEHRIEVKSWIRLAPSVYALASFPSTWQRQYKAAELCTPRSAIAGLAAGHVHSWEGFPTVWPEVVASHTANHRSRLAVVHRGFDVKVTTMDRIRVTTAAQTLCDILTRVRLDRWERVADHLLLSGRLELGDLDERRVAYELSRRPGIPLLRALVNERSVDGWSAPESELETMLRSAVALVPGCPDVRWQAPAPWGGAERVDGLIDAWGLVLEADGRCWHAWVRDFDRDRWRDNQAAAHGLRVQRFTYAHLTYRLAEVVEMIGQAGLSAAAA